MALPTSGVITMDQICSEFNINPVGVELGSAELRSIAGKNSTDDISMSDFYGLEEGVEIMNNVIELETDRDGSKSPVLRYTGSKFIRSVRAGRYGAVAPYTQYITVAFARGNDSIIGKTVEFTITDEKGSSISYTAVVSDRGAGMSPQLKYGTLEWQNPLCVWLNDRVGQNVQTKVKVLK